MTTASLTLDPIKTIEGVIDLPGSKSVSNRALLLAALATGTTTLTNLLNSDDVSYMLNSLDALGVSFTLDADGTKCVLNGVGGPFRTNTLQLFLGNAGTAMRPLCAALCLGRGSYTLTGEKRMEERPIGDLVTALQMAGAQISYLKNKGYPSPADQRYRTTGRHAVHRRNGLEPVSHRVSDGRTDGTPILHHLHTGRTGVETLYRHHLADDGAIRHIRGK
jgi:5-enolpyruvylshikimate-3-phosphate synthase